MKTYADYPKCCQFLAGDTRANSIPSTKLAIEFTSKESILADQVAIVEAAEAYLVETGLSDAELFDAGYHTNGGMVLDKNGEETDKCIGDLPDDRIVEEWKRLYAKYKLDYDKIEPLIALVY
jgi:hypothetical protein